MKTPPVQIAELELTFTHKDGNVFRVEPEFGAYLQAGIDATGKSVEETAKAIGLTAPTLYNIMSGKTTVILRRTAKKLARLSFMNPNHKPQQQEG